MGSCTRNSEDANILKEDRKQQELCFDKAPSENFLASPPTF